MSRADYIHFHDDIWLPTLNRDTDYFTARLPVCKAAEGLFRTAVQQDLVIQYGVFQFSDVRGNQFYSFAFQKSSEAGERTYYIVELGLIATSRYYAAENTFSVNPNEGNKSDLVPIRPILPFEFYNNIQLRSLLTLPIIYDIHRMNWYDILLNESNMRFQRDDIPRRDIKGAIRRYWRKIGNI